MRRGDTRKRPPSTSAWSSCSRAIRAPSSGSAAPTSTWVKTIWPWRPSGAPSPWLPTPRPSPTSVPSSSPAAGTRRRRPPSRRPRSSSPNPIVQRNLGDSYAQMGRPADAEKAYRTAVALCEDLLRVNPKDARMLGRLAAYEAKLGRVGAADRHAIDAVSLSPADGEVLYRKAVVEALSGRSDAALTSLREAVSRGYSPSQAKTDQDLASLKARPEF